VWHRVGVSVRVWQTASPIGEAVLHGLVLSTLLAAAMWHVRVRPLCCVWSAPPILTAQEDGENEFGFIVESGADIERG